jgi:hypothetical protein
MKRLKILILALLVLVASPIFMSQGVHAAGSLTVTSEITKQNVLSGESNTVKFFLTTTGTAMSGATIRYTLTNATITAYNPSGSPFTVNSVTTGGAVGSTTATIFVGYSAAEGGSGKQLVGTLDIATATGITGTATIATTIIDAFDADLNPMSIAGTNATYTVQAPPSNTPQSTPTTKPATPTTSPRTAPNQPPAAPVVAPDASGNPTQYSQQEVENVLANETASSIVEIGAKQSSPSQKISILLVGGVVMGIFLTVASILYIAKRRNKKNLHTATMYSTAQNTPISFDPIQYQVPNTIIEPAKKQK